MTPTDDLLDKAISLIGQHLTQLKIETTTPDEKGKIKALTALDSQIIDRYTKLLLAMNKTTGESESEFANLSDEELEALTKDETDVQAETSEA